MSAGEEPTVYLTGLPLATRDNGASLCRKRYNSSAGFSVFGFPGLAHSLLRSLETGPEPFMISLTPDAIFAAKIILENAKTPAEGLRILVEAGGCAGFSYKLDLETEARQGDAVVEADGVKIFIDDLSVGHVQGMTVDFVSSLEKSGFVFENPNATSQCGCGKSFA